MTNKGENVHFVQKKRNAAFEEIGKVQSIQSCLHCLYDNLTDPIAHLLRGDQLIIVPEGLVCLLPFAALTEFISIRTVPSLTSLKRIAESPEDFHCKTGALLVGDPCLEEITSESGVPILEQVQHAKEEVEMIGKL